MQGAGMKRRTFVAGSAALLTMPAIARAQTTKPTKRLAMIRPSGPVSVMTPNGYPYYKVFFEELARLGYVEGQNGSYSGFRPRVTRIDTEPCYSRLLKQFLTSSGVPLRE
jgi:hypothetical protein